MSPVALLVLVLGAAAALAKRLANPMIDRLGERLADWLFPPDRPTTYRLARGICWLSRLIAPRGTAAAAGVDAVFGDIDAIERGEYTYGGPIALARSTLPPAFRARSQLVLGMLGLLLLETPGAVIVALPIVLLLLYTKASGNALPGDSAMPSRVERRVCSALILLLHVCLLVIYVLAGPAHSQLFSLKFFVLTVPFFYSAACLTIADLMYGIPAVARRLDR